MIRLYKTHQMVKSILGFLLFVAAIMCCNFCFGNELQPSEKTMSVSSAYKGLIKDNVVSRNGKLIVAESALAKIAYNDSQKNVRVSSNSKSLGNLFDNSADTFWSPEQETGFIEINLGKIQKISALEWDGYTYGECFPTEFEIQIAQKDGDDFSYIKNIVFTGPSGRRKLKNSKIAGNVDSHNVRINLNDVKAGIIRFVIKNTSGHHRPRISRFEVLGNADGQKGSVIVPFEPLRVSKWIRLGYKGKGIASIESRHMQQGKRKWTDWNKITSSDLSFLNDATARALQIRFKLDNSNVTAELSSVFACLNGSVVGSPVPLIPGDDSCISNLFPTLMWKFGRNSDLVNSIKTEVQISKSKTFDNNNTLSLLVENTDNVKISDKFLQEGKRYYWRIRNVNGKAGNNKFSNTYSFTTGSTPKPRWNNSPFGINMGLVHKPWGEKVARDADFRWARVDYNWYRLQPSEKEWDWNRTDAEIDIARKLNISVLGILGYTPKFLAPKGKTDRHYFYRGVPDKMEYWINFVEKTVFKYRNDVAVWEIWNEQNHRGFFGDTPQDYAHLLKTAFIAIKNISPKSKVTFGGHAGFSPGYLDSVIDEIGNKYFELINWHCYPGMPDKPYYKMWLNILVNYREQHRLSCPIWLTEFGYARQEQRTEKEIASVIVAHMVNNCAKYKKTGSVINEKTFIFQLVEGHSTGKPQKWALLIDHKEKEPTVTKSYEAVKFAKEHLEKAKWLYSKETDGLFVNAFILHDRDESEKHMYVIWAKYGSKSTAIKLRVNAVLDVFGKDIVSDAGVKNQYTITRSPCYVFSKTSVKF